MPLIIIYLIKFSLSLAVVYLFYQFVLRRLTFYNANRWYLIGYCLLSFFIPFINVEKVVEAKTFNEMQVINFIPVIENNVVINKNYLVQTTNSFTLSYWDILLIILAIGSLIMVVRLLIQFLSLQKIKRKAIIINDAGTNIFHVDENIIPFSFGNAIYVNQNLHTEKEMEDIILHEYVHVKQKHTLDILLAEFTCIINWYNPFAWLIRHSIRQNLEFIADNDVLKKGLDKKSYQYHLLKVVGTPQYRIANSFNFSSLKKRIAMMNKLKSAKLHLVKFLFILPLIAVLLVAFRDKYEGIFKNHNSTVINEVGIIIDLSTKQPIAGVSVLDSISGLSAITDNNGFYSLKIPVKNDTGRIHIQFQFEKDGYEKNFIGHWLPASKLNSYGLIDIVPMLSLNKSATGVFIGPMGNKFPDEPTYEDALKELKNSRKLNDDLNDDIKLQKDHQEVSLFYSSEYKTHQIVIYKNGDIEKYGYPNGPTINDMEKKFGQLPDMMTKNNSQIPTDYLKKWESVAANAEKNFHTTNPDVYEIIFPGDSRVIAVPKNDKAKIYDMDNGAPEERRLFEKLYGSLTGIVPAPAGSFSMFNYDEKYKDWNIDGMQFVGFSSVVINREYSATHFVGNGLIKINPSIAKGLIIYNNKEYSAASFYKEFKNADHKFNDVFIYENKSAFDKFGDKAKNGVVVIGSDAKEISYNKNDTVPKNGNTLNFSIKPMPENPMYIVDGVQMPEGWTPQNSSLKSGDITNIGFLKNDSALILSKGKARNTIIYLTTKNKEKLKKDTTNLNINIKEFESYIIRPLQKTGPLYIVNGKEVINEENIYNINPNSIEQIWIIKDSSAIKQYGEKGRNGVIIIKTKTIEKKTDSVPVNSKATLQNKITNLQANKTYSKHPLYLIDGKVAGTDINSVNIKPEDIYMSESTFEGSKIKQYGDESRNGVVNFITKANKNNKAVHIPLEQYGDAAGSKKMLAQIASPNVLYLFVDNPLKISVQDINNENLIIDMNKEDGIIKEQNGFYYVHPNKLGDTKIRVFQKERNGSLKLLNSISYTVKFLPNPISVVHFNES